MNSTSNINTPDYWDRVYQHECESGQVGSGQYNRDYGPIHDAIIELIPSEARVLDIACGPGLLCRKIKERRPRSAVLGVDFSEYMIAQNQQRDQNLGVQYRCLDIRAALPDLAAQFDVVTMCEVLEHLDEPEPVVEAAVALVKPRGRFILSCPHDDAIPDPEHVRTWGHDDLFHLLARFSETVSFRHFPPPYFHIWMLAHLTKPAGTLWGSETCA